MSSMINQTTAFKITAFRPNQWLRWAKPHSTWSWKLTRLDDGRTRLVTRLKGALRLALAGMALLDLRPVRVR